MPESQQRECCPLVDQERTKLVGHFSWLRSVFTARIALWKVLFLVPPGCGFLCMKYLWNRRTDLCRIHMEDVFGPSLRQVWRSTVKITKDKKRHFSSLSAACVRFMFAQTSLASSFGSLNNFVKPHLSCCCHVSCLYGLSVCQVFCLNQDLLVTVMFCFYRLKLYRNHTNRY